MEIRKIRRFFDCADYLLYRITQTIGGVGILGLTVWGLWNLFR